MMEAYFKALAKRNASVTTDAYNIWRTQNPTKDQTWMLINWQYQTGQHGQEKTDRHGNSSHQRQSD